MATGVTVVKIGGSTLGRHDTSLDDLAALHAEGRRLVIVHGGGATISEWLEIHGVESRFVRGLRVTDERAMKVVVAVLGGLVNKQLVAELQARGAPAVGMSGADGAILRAERYDPELGFVGRIVAVDAAPLRETLDGGRIAVLSPLAIELSGEKDQAQVLNVNADTAAGEVAAALPADRLVFLTDVAGVLDDSGGARARLTSEEAREVLGSGAVTGGMIPKVEAALLASAAGVPTTIADGRRAGALQAIEGAPAGDDADSQKGTTIE